MQKYFKHLIFAFGLLSSIHANAAVVDIQNIDSGWYTKPGVHFPSIKNYYASENNGQRNYFVFDVSGIDTSSITAASFTVNTYNVNYSGVFTIYDVVTPVDDLMAQHALGAVGAAINEDLGSGNIYGSALITPSESNTFITVTLNSNFINDLKLTTGYFAIGGTFTGTEDPSAIGFGTSFFNTGNKLTLTSPVPENKSSYLLLSGLVLMGAACRRKINS